MHLFSLSSAPLNQQTLLAGVICDFAQLGKHLAPRPRYRYNLHVSALQSFIVPCYLMPAKVPFGKNWLHFDGCRVQQRMQLSLVCTVALLLLGIVPARAQPNPTIERLLIDGWEVAGYVAVAGNRSLILFGHKVHLVQCSVLIDVTRNPQIVTACYELK